MEQDKTLFPRLNELESKIGVEPGFLDRLRDEDDWSFIIKLHAVFEAVVTHLLTYHFQEKSLADLFARLELSNKTTGKIAFMKAIGWMGKDNRRYISSLSELRNSLVHDVRNCTFDLKEMVSKYSEKELKTFTVTFSPLETGKKLSDETPPRFREISHQELERLMVRARKTQSCTFGLGHITCSYRFLTVTATAISGNGKRLR